MAVVHRNIKRKRNCQQQQQQQQKACQNNHWIELNYYVKLLSRDLGEVVIMSSCYSGTLI